MNIKKQLIKTLLVGSLISATQAEAGIISINLDDFNSGNTSISDLTNNGIAATASNLLANGLTRNISDDLIASANPISNTVAVGFGILDITNGGGENSNVNLSWVIPANYISATYSNLSFDLTVVESDGNPLNIGMYLNGGLLKNFAIPGGTLDETLPVNFTPLQIAALSAGGTFETRITGSNGWDATFDSFGFTVIPEPATLSMIGIGLVGMSFFGRRKAKQS